jgi:hypothetical protein
MALPEQSFIYTCIYKFCEYNPYIYCDCYYIL